MLESLAVIAIIVVVMWGLELIVRAEDRLRRARRHLDNSIEARSVLEDPPDRQGH